MTVGLRCFVAAVGYSLLQVVFFRPLAPSPGQLSALLQQYGVAASPSIEAAFYVDLGARAVAAVAQGAWPQMEYTR